MMWGLKLCTAISRIFCAHLVLLVFSAATYADDECREHRSDEVIYQEISSKSGYVCIAHNEYHVVLRFLNKDGKERLINDVLIEKGELSSGVVSLDSSSGVELVFQYPRDVYVVSFGVEGNEVLAAKHVMRVPSVKPDEMVAEIELKARRDVLSRVSLESAEKKVLFDSGSLELSREQTVGINVRKAHLAKSPGGKATGMYLVKGDVVRLVNYSDGWVQVEYLTAKGRQIRMWTEFSNVL